MAITEEFTEKSVSDNPFIQFDRWYRQHLSLDLRIPEAAYLGTASSDGKVSVRTVLLKNYSEAGFVFFTNYKSRKGSQLASNRNAALLFYWPEMNRQVRIEGIAEKVPPPISDAYFAIRPRDSQIAAWASEQSSEIPGRVYLEEKFRYYSKIFTGFPVQRPDNWGGYMIKPSWFEFWEDRENRLHDRITYSRKDNDWVISRLAP